MHTSQQLLATLHIEATGVPIYVQLREQVLAAMGAGVLKPGDQMPTMRQVAVALRIDLNTVRHAYDELEKLGALRLERGRGSFVAEPPAPAHHTVQHEAAERLARLTLAKAKAAGVAPDLLLERIAALAAQKESSR
ncbi:GntR family transcriptional regulator [Phenylobacterium soli]|uniref:GntR family transcriptional regulator n=1 Tax=Phenylobacterium soli TaxID=2170551 RepID=A0A328AHX4_9CAUL|nr:GntR family transcriptional regulator [Phenylobacterium soli]RAK54360.1 GntR family transcriptional regulator [Phenylobacterium soli]